MKNPFLLSSAMALALTTAGAQAAPAAAAQVCSASALDLLGQFLHQPGFRFAPDGGDTDKPGTIVSAACKTHPVAKRLTIVSAAYQGGEADAKALAVALVDEAQRQVVASYRGRIDEDAAMQVEAASLRVDTPPYILAPGVRAFGIDVTSAYLANCGDGGTGGSRTLYVQEGSAIHPVLSDFTMGYWRYIQQGSSRCTGPDAPETTITENIKMTLAMSDKTSAGRRDITVTATSTRDDDLPSSRPPLRQDLHYDKGQYSTKELDVAFDNWRAKDLPAKPPR
jgi:hypothetical protein